MLKKILIPAVIILIGIFAISVLVVAKPKPTPQPPAEEPSLVKVAVAEAKPESMRLSVSAQGTVTPRREIDLVAQVSGQVMSVDPAFVNGGFFGAAQTLIQIDDRDYRAALSNARSQVAEAEQRVAEERGTSLQAKREWRELGSQTANDLFLRKPQLAAAEANLEAAKGALAVAEHNLERTRITVPFNGRVRETFVDLGEYVSAGAQLARVYDSSVVEVRLPLTEQQASLINLPLMATSTDAISESIRVTIKGSLAGEVYEWPGVLARTDAFVDSDSRMYYAIVEVADPFAIRSAEGVGGAPLLPGLFVEAVIEGKLLDNVLKLPRASLFERDKLMLLDADNKIVEHRVSVLRRSDTEVWIRAPKEVREGQQEGDATLISLEKQSLTPVGSVVEPVVKDDSMAEPSAVTAAPASN